ncbi:MAG TPA: hypothetical protein VFV34_27820 [Blastocatellia bacterium]|nr:hypothetical protein [Blastocatellia bacterium]
MLGIIVMACAILGPAGALSPLILSGGVLWKGMEVLGVLSKEGKGDGDWAPTRTRAIVGLVTSGAGILISLLLLAVAVLIMIQALLGPAR